MVSLAQLWGEFPLPALLSDPRSCPSTSGVAEATITTCKAERAQWQQLLHPAALSGTDRHSSCTTAGWTSLEGSRCPVGSLLFPPVRSAGSIPGKWQRRGHCVTGASLAAGMCPQGLQVLVGHWGCPSVQGHIAARAQQVKVHHPSTGCDTVVPTVGKDGTNMSHLYQVSAPSLEHAPCIPILCCSIPSCPLESWNCLGP